MIFNTKIRRLILFICLFLYNQLYCQDLYIQDSSIIRIASEPDYPPYCFIDEDGNPKGYSIDLIKESAKAVGLKLNIQIGVWSHIKAELTDGKIDALPLVGRTPERELLYDFTMPYLSLHGAIFVREGTNDIQSIEDLKHKRIVVMKGDNAEEFIRREKISEKLFTTNTFSEAFQELAAGDFDAVITQRIMGLKLLESLDIDNIIPLNIELTKFRQDFCFAVKKGNTELLNRLNEGLSIIIANRQYDKIRTKWFGPALKEELSFKDIIVVVLYTIIPLIILTSIFFIVFLRREVNKRTVRLQNEIANHKNTFGKLNEQKILLQESEERMRTMFEEAPLGIALIDSLSGNILEVNQTYAEIVGSTIENILSQTWMSLTHPDDLSESQKNIDLMNSWKIQGFNINKRLLKPDASEVWVNMTVAPINVEEPIKPQHLCMIEDITDQRITQEALKKNEEKLNTLFNTLTEMVVQHELVFNDKGEPIDYIITDCNRAFSEITNIKKEDAIGQLATKIYMTPNAPYLNEYSHVALSGRPYSYITYYEPMDKHFSISVVSPKKNHFATITTDITAIQQIQKVISDKNKELENYLYVASHDLRSPLVNIQGFSQRIKKHTDSIKLFIEEIKLTPEIKNKLEIITNESMPKTLDFIFTNVDKMDTLLNGLLQVSRTGRVKMTIKKIDMNELLKKIIDSLNYQITNISATINITPLPFCYGDADLLSQLFTNIITNALKYRNYDVPLIIDITAKTFYNKAIYTVKDNGIGIKEKHLDKIWDVFYRVNTHTNETGEGIGLSLAKRITDKHKGKIWATSKEGVGSIFNIELQINSFTE